MIEKRSKPSGVGFTARWVGVSCLLILVLAAANAGAEKNDVRAVQGLLPGTSIIVVVREGLLEPLSIGSYSLRAYAGTNPRFPYDKFIAGMLRPREGTVEQLRFADIDRDGADDVIVIMRSAGTGGYLWADAFRFDGNSFLLIATAAGLPKDTDPIEALEAQFIENSPSTRSG